LSRSDIETPIVWAWAAEIDIAKAMDASVAVFMNSPAQFVYEMRYFKFWLNFTFRPEAKVKRDDMFATARAPSWAATEQT
jgi:hypothetical protein